MCKTCAIGNSSHQGINLQPYSSALHLYLPTPPKGISLSSRYGLEIDLYCIALEVGAEPLRLITRAEAVKTGSPRELVTPFEFLLEWTSEELELA